MAVGTRVCGGRIFIPVPVRLSCSKHHAHLNPLPWEKTSVPVLVKIDFPLGCGIFNGEFASVDLARSGPSLNKVGAENGEKGLSTQSVTIIHHGEVLFFHSYHIHQASE